MAAPDDSRRVQMARWQGYLNDPSNYRWQLLFRDKASRATQRDPSRHVIGSVSEQEMPCEGFRRTNKCMVRPDELRRRSVKPCSQSNALRPWGKCKIVRYQQNWIDILWLSGVAKGPACPAEQYQEFFKKKIFKISKCLFFLLKSKFPILSNASYLFP